MADFTGEDRPVVKTKPKNALPQSQTTWSNPICKLFHREIGGRSVQRNSGVSPRIYQKLPGRLGFSLPSLVDECVLQDGHIFLGVSKNGHFVISYTFHLEADEHTAYPTYVYRLHWWRFIPYKRLKLLGEVRLFGEEELLHDLFLVVCEWPTDDSRVLVHGYCSGSEEKHQCYVTVTAVPPIEPCEDCSQLAILRSQNSTGYSSGLYSAPPRCLNHSFTVHTKYELAPPYPCFAPKIFLKLDGVVVINTGDSLLALSVDIEDNHCGFGFGLYSPRVTRSMSNLSTASSNETPSDDQMSCDSQADHYSSDARPFDDVAEFSSEPLLNLLGGQSPCAATSNAQRPNISVPKNTSNASKSPSDVHRGPVYREHLTSVGKENLLGRQIGSPPPATSSDASMALASRSLDVYNFEAGTPKKDEDTSEYYEVIHDAGSVSANTQGVRTKVRSSMSFTGFQQGARISTSHFSPGSGVGGSSSDEINFNSETDSQPLDDASKDDIFEKPTSIPCNGGVFRQQQVGSSNVSVPSTRSMSTLTLVTQEGLPFSKTVALSPGCGKWGDQGGSSTCSSCVSSPIILQSESQCFTYSVRKYVDYIPLNPESPLDVEDDLTLAYHSLLPLEIHGANYSPMKLLTKHCSVSQMPCVVVKQLTLDIEHYLGESVRTCADWGSRYLSFTDYDVQIVDICPETSEVIALVFALIRAKPAKDKKHSHGVRSTTKMYKTGFKLIWNLKTGSYNTLDVEDLVEVNQTDLIRKRWTPGHRLCEALQRRYSVPRPYCRSIQVLSNEPVLRGQSLKMLLDCHHYIAILL